MIKLNKKGIKNLVIVGTLSVLIIFGFVRATNSDRNFQIVKSVDIYISVLKELNKLYVDDVDIEKSVETSINSMLESLDPYTNYIPASEMDDFKFMTTGEYAGIGALIQKRKDYVIISEPYENFPAHKAGLKAGDKIIAINGKDMKGESVSKVSENLKGPAKTTAKVTIERPGVQKKLDITVTRENIHIDAVPYYGKLNDKTGLIILNNFTSSCSKDVEKAFKDLKENHKIENLILDLRGNPGGLMDESIKIANLFLPKGSEVVSTRGKIKQWDKVYKATSSPIDTVMPLIVLINSGSASASEIVAGALQDHDRAIVIGNRSFGKGLVQTTRSLPYNSGIKITTAKYYIPSGRCIQAVDYAKKNDDGSVALIPDSLMKPFQTKGGRTVLDGGGISPDISKKRDTYSNISVALILQHSIYDFVTDFAIKNKISQSAENITISNEMFNDLKKYVANLDSFKYVSESEILFNKLIKEAKKEGYYEINKADFDNMENKMKPDVERDMDIFRDEISTILANELATRFYFQKGSIKYSLTVDDILKEAVELFNDMNKFKGMLSGEILTHAGDKRKSSNVE